MNQLKVFISYRRSDTQHVAGRLGDRIGTKFALFMDIDDIPPGVDFTTVVRRAIDDSDVLLVLIGPHFLSVGADGERRLDKSGDWVAEEVGTGLARDIAVVPVLVDGAQMPSVAELPGKLKGLARRQALRLTHVSFNSDAERLIETLDDIERLKYGCTALPRMPDRQRAPAHPARRRPPPATCSAMPTTPGPSPPRSTGVGRRRSSCSKPWTSGSPTTTGSAVRWPKRGAACTSSSSRRRRPRPNVTDSGARRPPAWRNWPPNSPTTPDLLDRLERARREVRIEDLSGQLRAMFVAEEWVGVGVLSSQIAEIDPARADPEGLATTAAAISSTDNSGNGTQPRSARTPRADRPTRWRSSRPFRSSGPASARSTTWWPCSASGWGSARSRGRPAARRPNLTPAQRGPQNRNRCRAGPQH